MNYKILFSNLILLLIIILVIIYLLKDKIKESFFNPSNNCGPEDSEIIFDEEGNPIPSGGLVKPADYNPNDYYMCRNVGWQNTDTPYLTKRGQTWYDAEKKCQKDFRCQSFSFNGDTNATTSNVNYYESTNAVETLPSMWSTTKPNLYVKSKDPCITTTPVTVYNHNSSGNLKSSYLNIPYRYENKFIRENRKYMNDYDAKQFYDS